MNISLFVFLGISLSLSARSWADLPGSSTITAPNLLVSNTRITGTQGTGNFYQPNTWVFVANSVPSSSLNFTLSQADGKKFTLDNISFEHAEYLFNNANGWPNFQLSINSPSLATPLIYNIPYNYISNIYNNNSMVTFLKTVNSIPLISADMAITIYDVGGGYGSPSVSVRNIQVQSTVVPEPSALSLLAIGLGGLAMLRCRRS